MNDNKKVICSTWVAPIVTAKPMRAQQRGRLRKAGEEIVKVLKANATMLSCKHFYRALPDVPKPTLRRHLTELSSAGYLERVQIQSSTPSAGERGGRPYSFMYCLSATLVCT